MIKKNTVGVMLTLISLFRSQDLRKTAMREEIFLSKKPKNMG